MCVVLNLENKGYDLTRLTNYQQYYNLSDVDEQTLVLLCLKLSPDVMEGKCIFLNPDACGDTQNEFFNLRSTNVTVAAVQSVVVGEARVAVKKIMCYKLSWLQNNFLEPITVLVRKIKEPQQSRPAITYGHSSYSRPAASYPRNNYSSSQTSDSCCTIL
ncbi:unnamed protein product [Mytilus edulis]|nr:unnamed protein product [Mytilus edulis]